MKHAMILLFLMAFGAQAQDANSVSASLNEIVDLAHQSRPLDLLVKEFQFIKTVSALPQAEYNAAVQEVGARYSAEPATMYQLVSKLQYECRSNRFKQQQAADGKKSASAKWAQAVYESSEDFLSDLNSSGTFLPAILAAHAAEELPADQRGCPYDLLFHLASPANEMNEQVRRAENAALADIANDVAAAAPAAIALAGVAQRLGFAGVGASGDGLIEPVAAGGAASLVISQLIRSYGASKRENTLLQQWQTMKSQLDQGIRTSSNSVDAAADQFYLATMQLYAFYSYDLIEAQMNAPQGKPTFNIVDTYKNQCATYIDKRYLFEELKKQDVAGTMDVLRTASCGTKYDFTRWLADANGRGFANLTELHQVRQNFITASSPEHMKWLENEEQKLLANWGGCRDPLYFLFTVEDALNKWVGENPTILESRPKLLDVKNRIENKIWSASRIRHDVLAAIPMGKNACAFTQDE